MRYSRATFLADQHQFLILKITAGVETTSLVPAAHFKFKSWLNLKAHGAFVQRAIHSRDVSFYANSHLISTFWWHLAANCKLQTANQSQWKWRLINPPHPQPPFHRVLGPYLHISSRQHSPNRCKTSLMKHIHSTDLTARCSFLTVQLLHSKPMKLDRPNRTTQHTTLILPGCPQHTSRAPFGHSFDSKQCPFNSCRLINYTQL